MTEKLVHELSWDEVAKILFEAKGVTKGWWRVAVKMHFGAISGNWPQEGGAGLALPTGAIGVAGLALFETDKPGALTYDAATGKPILAAQGEPAPQGEPAKKRRTPAKKAIRK